MARRPGPPGVTRTNATRTSEGREIAQELEEVAADVDRTEVQLGAVLTELRTISARLDALERGRS